MKKLLSLLLTLLLGLQIPASVTAQETPVIARTSASGTSPYTITTSLQSKTYSGYSLRRQISSDGSFAPASLLYDGRLILTERVMAGTVAPDWLKAVPPLPNLSGTPNYYERQRIEAQTPLGLPRFSAWSNTISKTDAVAAIVLNSADMSSGMVLTNGNLTVRCNSCASPASIRATRGLSSGKGYWEVHIDTLNSGNLSIGAADSTQSLAAWWGNSGTTLHGVGTFSGQINGWSTYPAGPTYAASNTLGIAVDATAKKFWITKDGSTWFPSGGNPATGTGGYSISGINTPIIPGVQMETFNAQVTFNFGGSAFAFTVPTGFGPIP
jgi:hypothetical protein